MKEKRQKRKLPNLEHMIDEHYYDSEYFQDERQSRPLQFTEEDKILAKDPIYKDEPPLDVNEITPDYPRRNSPITDYLSENEQRFFGDKYGDNATTIFSDNPIDVYEALQKQKEHHGKGVDLSHTGAIDPEKIGEDKEKEDGERALELKNIMSLDKNGKDYMNKLLKDMADKERNEYNDRVQARLKIATTPDEYEQI